VSPSEADGPAGKTATSAEPPQAREFKRSLKASLGEQEYQTWFAPARLRLEDEAAVLEVPNRFFAQWIKERYQGVVERALAAACGSASHPLRLEVCPGALPFAPPVEAASPVTAPSPPPPAISTQPEPLNPRYTFDSFVVGPCNELAHAACQAVAEQPGRQYNPLFIFGGAGLGKTHLLIAAGNHMRRLNSGISVHYTTCEDFTNELIRAVRFDGIQNFKAKYRQVDCLLLDDIQFIAGRERTQEELFHTFNALFEAGKQIIVTSDKMPREIPSLEKRLRTRFEWGLLADMQPPDPETKVAILQKKAAEKGISLPKRVAFFLARQPETNVRVLEGYLTRLMAVSRFSGQEITEELVKRVLGPMVGERRVEVEEVIRAVAAHFGVKVSDLKGGRKTRDISLPRQVAMFLARQLTSASFPSIGKSLGGKDHSTVVKGVKKIKALIKKDPELRQRILALQRSLQEPEPEAGLDLL